MAGDLTALVSAWSGLSGSTSQKLTTLNSQTVGTPIDLPVDSLVSFVKNSGKLAGVLAFVNNTPAAPNASALLAANYLLVLLSGQSGSVVPAAQVASLLALLDNVSADARTGITAGNVVAFNNICMPQVPWWQAHSFSGPITLFDLMAAGNLS